MGLRRANIGCGSIQPDGWDNYDLRSCEHIAPLVWDIKEPASDLAAMYDYAVCSFMLQELSFHELPGALGNIAAILKPAGVLRVMVPDVLAAFSAYLTGDETWFPQDERSGRIDGKFCSYITWFGTVRSVFTEGYLTSLLAGTGFVNIHPVGFRRTYYQDLEPGLVELDDREREALIFEAARGLS